jgi:hypothetical protein
LAPQAADAVVEVLNEDWLEAWMTELFEADHAGRENLHTSFRETPSRASTGHYSRRMDEDQFVERAQAIVTDLARSSLAALKVPRGLRRQ